MEKEYNFKQSEKRAIPHTSKGSGFSCLNSHKDNDNYKLRNTIDWIVEHIKSENGINPSNEILDIFKENNWLYSGIIYRGIHWGNYYELYDSPDGKFKLGNSFTTTNKISSWTKNKKIALCFAGIGAYDTFVLSLSNSKFTFSQRFCIKMKYYDGTGIVIKAKIKNGLDIQKAIIELEKTNLENYLMKNIPMLAESEILVLKPIKSKIIAYPNILFCK